MPYFKDRDELFRCIGGLFEEAVRDDALIMRLGDDAIVLKLVCSDPEAVVVVDMRGRAVRGGAAADAADVELRLAGDVAHRFFLGKVNLPVAIATGTVRVKGPLPKLLKVLPLSKELFPRYRALLERDGRTDLIV